MRRAVAVDGDVAEHAGLVEGEVQLGVAHRSRGTPYGVRVDVRGGPATRQQAHWSSPRAPAAAIR